MMRPVLEDSVEGFVARFRSAAASVLIASRVEGDPLIECIVGDRAVHALERTGPYLARSGPAQVILHAECDHLERLGDGAADGGADGGGLEVLGVSRVTATGVVRSREDPFVVIDAGVPLVVGVIGAIDGIAVGDLVRLTCRPPLHGFVLPSAAPRTLSSPDDQV